jgi:trk system potassium uptake protein TrkA
MQVTIIGAGAIGAFLAERLIQENHDVTIVESNNKVAEYIRESLDAMVIHGDGTNPMILEKAMDKKTKLVIAMTNDDRTNILIGLMAQKYDVDKIVIRIGDTDNLVNPLIVDESDVYVVNPEMTIAKEILRLISVPVAEEVDVFAQGKAEMLKLMVTQNAPVAGKNLKEISLPESWIFIGHTNGDKFTIPKGDTMLNPGDHVLALGSSKTRNKIEQKMGLKPEKIDKVVILGGGKTVEYVAEQLNKKKVSVIIIESNETKAKELADELQSSLVMHGDGTSSKVLDEAGIADADYFIAITKNDELNVLSSLLAKHMGANRVIVLSTKSQYTPVIEKLGIETAVSSRSAITEDITRFTRRKEIQSVVFLEGGKSEILEIMISESSNKVLNIPLKKLPLPRETLIGLIIRGEEVLIPTGENVLEAGDRVILFSLPNMVNKLVKIFRAD